MSEKYQTIQALRFIAASLVVITHASRNFSLGNVGVDIFFVISGFIIARLLPRYSVGGFLRSRLTRIYPFWWLMLAPAMIEQVFILENWSLPRAIASVTLWPAFSEFEVPYLFVGWTLCFEMLFYLGATIVLANRRAPLWLLAGYVMALIGAFVTRAPLLLFIGNPIIIEFLLGVLVARAPSGGARYGAVAIPLAIASIVAASAAELSHPRGVFELTQPMRALVWGIPAALLVWGALQFEDRLKGRLAVVLSRGGDASYAIYLVHVLVIDQLAAVVPWTIVAALAIAIGLMVHRDIELPLLRAVRGIGILRPANQLRVPAELGVAKGPRR